MASATQVSSGDALDAAYRHDVILRETTASAERRAEEQAAAAAAPEPETALEDEAELGAEATGDIESVRISAPALTWGAALRQLTEPRGDTAATEPERPAKEPLTTAELAGVEAVLVGLRLEALVEALDRSGAIRRSQVDDAFLRLIEERFVTEATPVVGDAVAPRVVKELLDG